MLISHDRWLLRQDVDCILDVKRGGPAQFRGTYDEYRRKDAKLSIRKKEPTKLAQERLSPREVSKAIERLRREVAEMEAAVGTLEGRLVQLESDLANPKEGADLVALAKEHTDLKARLEKAIDDWSTAAETLEALLESQTA